MGKWPKLDGMKLSDNKVDDHTYDKQLKKLQNRLLEIQQHYLRTGGRAIIGVDGWDAAGKGGMIQRFVFGLEPRSAHEIRDSRGFHCRDLHAAARERICLRHRRLPSRVGLENI